MSLARAHFQRHAAAALNSEERPVDRSLANAYELMLAKLAEDRRRLKDVQSIERKADVKRQLLPEYDPWIQGVLEGNSGRQDDVLMSVMVWRIDVGDIKGALPLARYAIEHGLSLPDQYKRTTACLIAEEAAEMSIKGASDDTEALLQVEHITADEDMPDEVRAKLHKAIGYALRTRADGKNAGGILEQARDHLQRALDLHNKSGVKKDIERLDTAIKNSASADQSAG